MGRRVQKVVETYDGSSWSTNAVTKFVWDLSAVPTGQAGGWLLIAELDGLDSDALTRTYTWGLDLSGTFRGAGGIRLRSGSYGGHVGGLLMVDDDTGDGFCGYYTCDGNGNVGQILDAEDLSTDAHYEYDPYGREIVATGTYADENPWRFSTKYLDVLDPNDIDASLLYYGHRHLSPRLGRWMSRDPIGERGGANLFAFAANNAVRNWDADGRHVAPIMILPPGVLPPRWTCESARKQCEQKANEFHTKGYLLAEALLRHYLKQGNVSYIPDSEDVSEITENGKAMICAKIAGQVCRKTRNRSSVSVNIAPKDPSDSNVRWWWIVDNQHMFNAYGGARMKVTGSATRTGVAWSGDFDVELFDRYEFDKSGLEQLKEMGSEMMSRAYEAALFLEKNCGYEPFDHKASFPLECSGCCGGSPHYDPTIIP